MKGYQLEWENTLHRVGVVFHRSKGALASAYRDVSDDGDDAPEAFAAMYNPSDTDPVAVMHIFSRTTTPVEDISHEACHIAAYITKLGGHKDEAEEQHAEWTGRIAQAALQAYTSMKKERRKPKCKKPKK